MHAKFDRPARSRKPGRICFVTEALGPGGAERVISLLASHWAAAGWHVAICTFDAPGDAVYHRLDERITLIRLGHAERAVTMVGRSVLLARRVVRLRAALLSERPDAVLSFLTKINAITLAATIATGLRVAACERNNPARQNAHPLWNLALRLLLRRADSIVAQTKRALGHIPASLRGKAIVIPNPIETPPGVPAPHDTQGIMRLVAVGRLTPQKGFDLLIEAFSLVGPAHPGWQLDIWGEGAERRTLDRLIRASPVADRIVLRGVSGIQGGWAEDASAFVLPSRYEGFPNVLGEAMACGLPVVAFDCPYGPRELVRNGYDGLLVQTENVAALARTLDRVMATPWLRCMLGENAARSARRFAPAQITHQWETLLARLMRRKRESANLIDGSGKAAGSQRPI